MGSRRDSTDPEQGRRILDAANLRAKSALTIVGFTSQRLEVLGGPHNIAWTYQEEFIPALLSSLKGEKN